jgi:hypothetical protein
VIAALVTHTKSKRKRDAGRYEGDDPRMLHYFPERQ